MIAYIPSLLFLAVIAIAYYAPTHEKPRMIDMTPKSPRAPDAQVKVLCYSSTANESIEMNDTVHYHKKLGQGYTFTHCDVRVDAHYYWALQPYQKAPYYRWMAVYSGDEFQGDARVLPWTNYNDQYDGPLAEQTETILLRDWHIDWPIRSMHLIPYPGDGGVRFSYEMGVRNAQGHAEKAYEQFMTPQSVASTENMKTVPRLLTLAQACANASASLEQVPWLQNVNSVWVNWHFRVILYNETDFRGNRRIYPRNDSDILCRDEILISEPDDTIRSFVITANGVDYFCRPSYLM